MESRFSGPEESPGFLLWQVSNLWQKMQRKALLEFDLTHVQFVLLAGIGWLEGKLPDVSQAILSKHAKTDLMMTSQVLRTLENKKLILRKKNDNDPRAFSLSLTPLGKNKLQKALKVVEEVDHHFFSSLSVKSKNFIESLKVLTLGNP